MNDKQLSKAATKGGKIVSLLYFVKKVTLEYLYLLKQDNTLSVCPAVEEVEVLHQWTRKQVLPRLDCKWI